ncbi:MAG: phosphate acyltransferase PlsX [Rikenellaceae bacterium]|nr:phosphate acyltransferase PlsX [Rikenellaceae bacterium]
MLRIGIDAMGGDFAPEAVVKGAIAASRELPEGSTIVLFGDQGEIGAILAAENHPADAFEIVHTTEVIGMNEHPAQAFVKKTDSSVVVGFHHLQAGKIDGFASAGNTGAILVGSMQVMKQIEGVIRPAISAQIHTSNGRSFLLLDVGLNVDCKPEVLYQYAVIGNAYAQNIMKLESPRVALLSIGEEKEKGNIASKAAYELMEQGDQFRFVGNVESKYIFTGELADVVVCDGFVGNIILKQAEGFYEIAKANGVDDPYINKLNYEIVGGTPVLGINGNVMVGHGCSSPFAIKNMILQTEKTIRGRLVRKLCEIFN